MSEKNISEINIIYDIYNKKEIQIFGVNFVDNNKNICKIIIDNKECKLSAKYKVKNNNKRKLKIKLKGIDKVTDMSYMFSGCRSLSSLPDISKWNTNKVTKMEAIFISCGLSCLPDISKWNTNKVTDFNNMFMLLYIIIIFTKYFKMEYQ